MPSDLINRIMIDCNIPEKKITQWHDEGKEILNKQGIYPNDLKHEPFLRRYVERRLLQHTVDNKNTLLRNGEPSKALQSLVKSILSEIEAERNGVRFN